MSYDIGDSVRLSVNFCDAIKVGNYHFDYAISQSGRYWYRWQGTGAYPSAVEGYFVVKPSQF